MSKTYNWLVYHAIKKKFQFEYVKFIDEENYIIDYENSTPNNEGSFLTSNNSKFRKVENFISVVFFIILFGPLRVFFSTTYFIWVVVIYIAFFLLGLTILFPGLENVFFG